MQSSGEIRRENDESWIHHCEPTGPRKARPDDRLREAIQSHTWSFGLLVASLLAITKPAKLTDTFKRFLET
jgi:hypothetical protein